jgi:hypothetical protein
MNADILTMLFQIAELFYGLASGGFVATVLNLFAGLLALAG